VSAQSPNSHADIQLVFAALGFPALAKTAMPSWPKTDHMAMKVNTPAQIA
jgi:hypothetical protein